MAQGFNPYRHRPSRNEASRWARFADVSDDPFPTHPDILRFLIDALRGRIRRMDRTKKTVVVLSLPVSTEALRANVEQLLARIHQLDRSRNRLTTKKLRLYIQAITQRERWPNESDQNWFRLNLGHYNELFREEFHAIESGTLASVSCLPAVLQLQHHHLCQYLSRSGPDGYHRGDTPSQWFQRNHTRLVEELSFYHCACIYQTTLDAVNLEGIKGPGELIPAILAGLHTGPAAASIRQMVKVPARPSKLPSFLT